MSQFSFTLTIEGADAMTDEAQDALFESGCHDATFGISDSLQNAAFDREACDFADAVASAITAVESAVQGARVVEVQLEQHVAPRSVGRVDSPGE